MKIALSYCKIDARHLEERVWCCQCDDIFIIYRHYRIVGSIKRFAVWPFHEPGLLILIPDEIGQRQTEVLCVEFP